MLAAPAFADTLDFSGLPGGNLGSSVSVGGATLEGIGNSSIRNQSNQYFQNAGGSVCAQKGSGNNCRGDMNIKFNGKVKKLSFSSAGYQAGDTATIVVYRGKNVVGTTGFAWNGKVNLSAYKGVTRIKIEYEGVEDGMAIGKFNFTRVAGKRGNDALTGVRPGMLLAADIATPRDGGHGGSARADGKGNGGGKGGDGTGNGKGGDGKGGGKSAGGGEARGSGNKGK